MDIKGLDPVRAYMSVERVALVKDFIDRFGPEALEVIDERNQRTVVPGWKGLGEQAPEVTIEAFVELLWERFCRRDGLEFTMEASPEKIQMHCTYCPWAEVARAAGSTEAGYHLYCLTDPFMVEGFNQAAGPDGRRIKFSRRKTLMQGDDCCDHCYEYE